MKLNETEALSKRLAQIAPFPVGIVHVGQLAGAYTDRQLNEVADMLGGRDCGVGVAGAQYQEMVSRQYDREDFAPDKLWTRFLELTLYVAQLHERATSGSPA